MGTIKKLLLLTLSLLLMSSGFKVPASAFLNCTKKKCAKQKALVLSQKRLAKSIKFDDTDFTSDSGDKKDDLTDDNKSSSGNSNLDDESSNDSEDSSSESDKDDGSSDPSNGGDGPIGPGAGSGGTGDGSDSDGTQCATNMAILGIAKSFVSCQIRTAIDKGNKVISIYSGLHRRMKRLLKSMKRAPVCTNDGYDLGEFDLDHSVLANLKAMRNVVKSMKSLLKELEKISLDCNSCEDDGALNSALAAVNEISKKLAGLITDFKNEMSNVDSRFDNFITRLKAVIGLHSTNPFDIMAECNVTYKQALRMSRIRQRIIKSVDKLVEYKAKIDEKIAKIGFGSHPCVKAALTDLKNLAVACLSL